MRKFNRNLNEADETYLNLMQKILDKGVVKEDRTGVGTKSIFGEQIAFDMRFDFPILTTKKVYFKGVVHELLWFLKGDTNIKYLVDNGINIWNGNAYDYYCYKVTQSKDVTIMTEKQFIEKIKAGQIKTAIDNGDYKLGDLGNVYGKQWRDWDTGQMQPYYRANNINAFDLKKGDGRLVKKTIDQIAKAIDTLKNNPDSRRILVNAWNVAEVEEMSLPPCHFGFQLYSHEMTIEERWLHWDNANWPFNPNFEHNDDYQTEEQYHEYYMDKMDKDGVPSRYLSLMWNQRSVDTFLGEFAPSESNFCRTAA